MSSVPWTVETLSRGGAQDLIASEVDATNPRVEILEPMAEAFRMTQGWRIIRFLPLVAALVVSGGCGQESSFHADGHTEDAHGHTAKYGGKLVELGRHEANLEFVFDPTAGRLTAYALDAHAENFVRLPLDGIAVQITVGGTEHPLVLAPVGNAATGEKPGDTSQFQGAADWLKSAARIEVLVKELPFKSKQFRDIRTTLP